MGYRSNVAFSFDEHNWKSLCERAKTNKNALSEHNSFNDMLKYADINREVEFLEIKFHRARGVKPLPLGMRSAK